MEKKQPGNSFRVPARDLIGLKKGSQSFSVEGEESPQICASARARFMLTHSLQHLPTSLTPLIGREQEVEVIRNLLLQTDVRLLTLAGPGGVGKTRLAMQILTEVSSAFADGACFISLASIDTISLLTIAQLLGFNEKKDHCSYIPLKTAMQEKRLLLILDNFEHIVDEAPQVKKLLAMCPHLKVLVTSRTVLRLSEERIFYVAPLALPDQARLPLCEELSQTAAVSLFLQLTRTIRPDFKLTSENASTVAQICVHLDGLPLALELAAARMNLFSTQDLLTRLDRRFSLLTNGMRDAPERQQTLHKTMEWSYRLLKEDEQWLFRRLAVFVDGCSLQAIEAICEVNDKHSRPILDVITSLVDQSLLQIELQVGNEEQRFTMLRMIREYALECLQNSDEEEIIRQTHAEYYMALAETIKLQVLRGEPPYLIERAESEFENLRAAFNHFHSLRDVEQALKMSGALWALWSHNHMAEGYYWVMQALESCQQSLTIVHDDTRAQALFTAAMIEYNRGNWKQADVLVDESLHLFRTLDNTRSTVVALITQGIGALLQDRYEVAQAAADESIHLLQKMQNSWLQAEAYQVLAYSFYYRGEYLHAYTLGKEALAMSQQTDKLYTQMRAIYAQALFAEAQGKSDETQAMYKEGMEITKATIETGPLSSVAICLMGMGAIAALQEHYTWAVRSWGKAKALYCKRRNRSTEWGPYEWGTILPCTHLHCSQVVETVHRQLGEQAFTTGTIEGQAMSLEFLIAGLQLQVLPTTIPSSPVKAPVTCADGLTTREREVLCLLAQGISSALIAEKLVIGLTTVNSHVRTIYSKLGISSRSAATRYAVEHHLV